MITKEEWVDWKNDPVTEAFMETVNERIEDAKEILANSAGIDNANDNFMRGFIKAFNEMLDFRVEDE